MQSGEGDNGTNEDGGAGGGGGGSDNCRLTLCSTSKRKLSPTKVSSSEHQSEQDLDVDQFQLGFRYLPDWLLVEILVRLPVESVFRFKCISKHWFSLISDPSFARLYASRKSNSSSVSPFIILYRYVYVSVFQQIVDRLRPDVFSSENFSVLFLSTFEEQQQADQFKILAASKGLLLCCLLGPLIYYVCDPVTKQWISLPKPRNQVPSRHPVFFGEGLVALADRENLVTSYKVVRVEWLCEESNYLNVESFSYETREWKNYRLSCPQPVRLLKRGSPFIFNGIMHWFTCGNGVVAFDPYKDVKECRLIKLPRDRDIEIEYKHDGLYRLCDECQGQLRYFEVAPETAESFCFSMWVMKDYDKVEWHLEQRATRNEIWSDDPYISSYLLRVSFVPLVYDPFNLDIVYLRCVERSCIVTYNIRTNQLEVSCHPVGIVEDLSWRMVIPFVLPNWPAPLPLRSRRGIKRSRFGDTVSAH